MKEILISSNKKITSDDYGYVYSKKINNNWHQKWYYSSLRACYDDLLEEFTKDGEKETLKKNVEEAVRMLKEIKEIKIKKGIISK